MFAGHETTSVQLIWLLHALAQKPAIQTRLRDEIREAREKAGLRGVSDPVLPLRATSEDGEGGGEGKVPEREEGEAGQEGDGQGRELTYAEVEDLQYLDWVVQEGLRLMGPSESPLAPFLFPSALGGEVGLLTFPLFFFFFFVSLFSI